MRIGVVAPEFPPDIGGIETYAYEFSKELARRGHDVFVFTLAESECEIEMPGIKVLPVLSQKYQKDRQLPKIYSMDVWHVMNAGYAWLATETNPVIVSVHGNDFISPYHLPMRPNLPRLPGLWRVQPRLDPLHSWVWRKASRWLMRRGLSRARQVIANSEYTKSVLVRCVPQCGAKTSVGFVGVADEFLQMPHRRRRSDRTKRLVTVCRLAEPRKNVDKVLQALTQLKQYRFQYTIVGDGRLRCDLEALCRQLGIEDRVSFTGSIPKTEIPCLLASSDLFIMASGVSSNSVEGFGIAYLEANACGTPVLAARAAGAVEAVNEGKTGYFVDEPSIPAITEALERFLTGDITFKSEECHAFASRFTWPKVVDHAMHYYVSGSRDDKRPSSRSTSALR
jgi:phosphatidylinositol alpha-1,6-mannosyltransferase